MSHFSYLIAHWRQWIIGGGELVGAVIVASIVYKTLLYFGGRFAHESGSALKKSLIRHGKRPFRLIFPLLALFLALPATPLPSRGAHLAMHAVGLGLIAAVAWMAVLLIDVFEDVAAEKYQIGVSNDLRARKIRTQINVLRRTLIVVVSLIALAIGLMTFPTISKFGYSIFASAGVAGLVIGFAAKPTLTNLVAGIQIALTEPIRLEDVVIVENEWGWIEEITTTYVVIRIWDLRRLVVPISYFVEKPFQNWTRVTADLLGSVHIFTDYTVPVEELRQELHRVLQTTDLWDRKVWVLQVTHATENTLELRALVSAADSSKSWDLRCYVREKLITFLQQNFPECLPRTRVEMEDRKAGKEVAPGPNAALQPASSGDGQTADMESRKPVIVGKPSAKPQP